MKRLLEMFRLTKNEQRVVVILILILLAGALVSKSRQAKAPRVLPSPAATPSRADPD
jgi:hypothetical protein